MYRIQIETLDKGFVIKHGENNNQADLVRVQEEAYETVEAVTKRVAELLVKGKTE